MICFCCMFQILEREFVASNIFFNRSSALLLPSNDVVVLDDIRLMSHL